MHYSIQVIFLPFPKPFPKPIFIACKATICCDFTAQHLNHYLITSGIVSPNFNINFQTKGTNL